MDKKDKPVTLTLEEEMTTRRRKYTADFTREAVQLWQTSGKTAAEIEQELGISADLLGRWKRKLRREGSAALRKIPR